MSCPNKNHPSYKLLVQQLGSEEAAIYTWKALGNRFPETLVTMSELKAKLGVKSNMSANQVINLAKRIKVYNSINNTSHSFTKTQKGQSDNYIITLNPSYLHKSQLFKQKELFTKHSISNSIDLQSDVFKDVGSADFTSNTFIVNGEVYPTLDDARAAMLRGNILFQDGISSADEIASIKANAVRDGVFMKAPNGQKTNLTEQQWITTRTKSFKNWFGDWENDPASSSKVLDKNGEPLVQYHYGGANQKVFRFKNIGRHFGTQKAVQELINNKGELEVFNDTSMEFEKVPAQIYEAFLNLKNPLLIKDAEDANSIDDYKPFIIEALTKEGVTTEDIDIINSLNDTSVGELNSLLQRYGFDGFYYVNQSEDKGSISYVVTSNTSLRLVEDVVTAVTRKDIQKFVEQGDIVYLDEEGNPCAKAGGRNSKFTKGSKWEIIKDLEGYPSHSQ